VIESGTVKALRVGRARSDVEMFEQVAIVQHRVERMNSESSVRTASVRTEWRAYE
jgi:hypothetical protein